MANPLIDQGVLNRLRGSVLFTDNSGLNVTAPFLAPEGIGMTLEGDATTISRTMTGIVPAPEPYMLVTVELNLLKTQFFSDLWKTQFEQNTRLGDCVVRPDATTLSPFFLFNTSITTQPGMRLNGTTPAFVVNLQGYWVINAELWAAAL